MGRYVPNMCSSGGSSTVYTKTEVDTLVNGKVSKSGDTMTGNLAFATANIGVVRKDGSGASWRDGAAIDGAITTTQI